MEEGQFCFISEQYYIDFPDKHLMRNREAIDGVVHRRPCFFVFPDRMHDKLFWLVPISSKYNKFKALHDKKTERYGKCNTICFGKVLGMQAAIPDSKYVSHNGEIYKRNLL
jgi:hypothetical protein